MRQLWGIRASSPFVLRSGFPTAPALFALELVRGTGELVNLGRAVERLVLRVDEGQLARGQQTQGLGDVQHAEDVEEDRAITMRGRRIHDDNLFDARLEQGSVRGEDSRLS